MLQLRQIHTPGDDNAVAPGILMAFDALTMEVRIWKCDT